MIHFGGSWHFLQASRRTRSQLLGKRTCRRLPVFESCVREGGKELISGGRRFIVSPLHRLLRFRAPSVCCASACSDCKLSALMHIWARSRASLLVCAAHSNSQECNSSTSAHSPLPPNPNWRRASAPFCGNSVLASQSKPAESTQRLDLDRVVVVVVARLKLVVRVCRVVQLRNSEQRETSSSSSS